VAQPEDFLAQATKLLKSAAGDADYRTIITQAYYAAFHSARLFEEILPERSQVDTSKVGSHEGLLQRLEAPSGKLDYGLKVISKDVGAQLRMLKALREIASYELDETVRVDQAEEAIAAARDLMAECGKGSKKLGK
jgi:uncharacterized protein (UPF0332 family)